MNSDTLRVRAPSQVLFLCGGVIDSKVSPPATLRDYFFRETNGLSTSYTTILAEAAQPLTSDAGYSDLLSFESDIAQVVGLILLFAESAGSLAELGAFAAKDTIAPSLLAILDDYYYEQSSFIRNGPVKYLENQFGEEWILVLERNEVGISTTGTVETVDARKLAAAVQPTIDRRLARRHIFHTFSSDNDGHLILLLTGLCQEFGALTISEIQDAVSAIAKRTVSSGRLKNFIYCSELLGWIKRIRKGNNIFYVATGGEFALDYTLISGVNPRDKVRWRTDIRSFWQKKEPIRIRAISDARLAPVAAT